MSSKERAQKAQEREDRRLQAAAEAGLRQMLASSDGRAFLWWFYSVECRAEEVADPQRRAVGLALAQWARRADWSGWQAMREEWERPRAWGRLDEADEDDEPELDEGA